MARVRPSEEFVRDLEAQLAWIAEHGESGWATGLRDALDVAFEQLGDQPATGTIDVRRGTKTIRKLFLRVVPFVLWHAHDSSDASGSVLVLRLFHVKQDGPEWAAGRRRRSRRRRGS